MAQFITIRRFGADVPGWSQLVEHLPPVGSLLRFGCAPSEWIGPAESNLLVREGPWRVQALVYHFLCPTEGEDIPADALSVEVIIVPAEPHERVLVADVTVQHAGKPDFLPAIPRLF